MTSSVSQNILVIGAGVIGLQTALTLLEAGYRVTVLARHFPGDRSIEYTSPWAGAQWRSHAATDDVRQQRWDRETYLRLRDVVKSGNGERCGIVLRPMTLVYDTPKSHPDFANSGTDNPGDGFWFREFVENFRETEVPSRLRPGSRDPRMAAVSPSLPESAKVFSFTTLFINPEFYLPFLLDRIQTLGGQVIRAGLPTTRGFERALDAAERKYEATLASQGKHTSSLELQSKQHIDVFINATGIGARDLVGDGKMHPVRGQVLEVKGVAPGGISRQGSFANGDKFISYVIPRPSSGTTIVGGVNQSGNWSGEADERVTQEIFDRCQSLAPELLTGDKSVNCGFELVNVGVGLRPGREGGPRVEEEEDREDGRRVVHVYGHKGGGYQNSVGVAMEALDIVKRQVLDKSKL